MVRSVLLAAVLALALQLAFHQVDANPIPGRGFNFTTYVSGVVGPAMAMDTVGDLYVASGTSTWKFPRTQWNGVSPIVASSASHLLTTANGVGSLGAMVSNSKGRIYHSYGCELNKTTGVWSRCGIWSNAGYGVSVDPANDDIITSHYTGIKRVANPDNHTAPITSIPIWDSPPSFGGITIDGVYMDRLNHIFLADLAGSVIIINATNGALIQRVFTASLGAGVPDGIAASGDGKTVVLGMTSNRMASMNLTDYSLQLFSDGVGEGYHDFSVVGPDGCIYQSDWTYNKILRITREDGTCDFVSAVTPPPPPSSPCGSGCASSTVGVACEEASVQSASNCATLHFSETVSTCN